MANAALGSKRVCTSCAARFYDLTRAPAVCPKCGHEQPLDLPRVSRPVRGLPPDRRFRKAVVVEAESEPAESEAADSEDAEEEDEVDETADEEAVLIDDEDEKAEDRGVLEH